MVVMTPPSLANLPSGRYAVAGSTWIRVPDDTTLEDLDKYMTENTYLEGEVKRLEGIIASKVTTVTDSLQNINKQFTDCVSDLHYKEEELQKGRLNTDECNELHQLRAENEMYMEKDVLLQEIESLKSTLREKEEELSNKTEQLKKCLAKIERYKVIFHKGKTGQLNCISDISTGGELQKGKINTEDT